MSSTNDNDLELYKLEYEKGAERYDNIYKSIWTNFSYMAIVAGAILSFGGSRLDLEIVLFLACLPLIFWYWATFEPMNRYGDQVIERLSWVERILNKKYSLENNNFEPDLNSGRHTGLHHFTNYLQSRIVEINRVKIGKLNEEKTKYGIFNSLLVILALGTLIILFTGSYFPGARWISIGCLVFSIIVLTSAGCVGFVYNLLSIAKRRYALRLLTILLIICSTLFIRKFFQIWQYDKARILSITIIVFLSCYLLWEIVKFKLLEKIRVRVVIRVFFLVLHTTAIVLLVAYFSRQLGAPLFPRKPTETKTFSVELKDKSAEVKVKTSDLDELNKALATDEASK